MDAFELDLAIPEALVSDFASDPLSPYDKVLRRLDDPSWPLFNVLRAFVDSLPRLTIEWAYADETFMGIYGPNERLARIWFTQHLLAEEAANRRLTQLTQSGKGSISLPYSVAALQDIKVDNDDMVRLSSFTYNGSSLQANGQSFTTCLVNQSFNSTYWLQEAFYEEGVANDISVRLDPFLWGPSGSFSQMGYKMFVYAMPVNWRGLANLREPHHGQMRPEMCGNRTELTEYCWTPRDDGIHFVCEELPRRDLIRVQAARYLHAIYDPHTCAITHFDGALRIYSDQGMADRLKVHVRNAGKAGIRKKIFRIDMPIRCDAFSLIAQAFFVWNEDLTRYFRETLQQGI